MANAVDVSNDIFSYTLCGLTMQLITVKTKQNKNINKRGIEGEKKTTGLFIYRQTLFLFFLILCIEITNSNKNDMIQDPFEYNR